MALKYNELIVKALNNNANKHIITTQNITGTTDKNRIHANLIESKNTSFVFLDSVNISYSQNLKEAKFLVGILNSRIIDWLFRKTSTNNHCNKYELESLPIPKITESNKPLCDEIIKCVEQILSLRAEALSPSLRGEAEAIHKQKELESKIDSLVYTLYNLTNDEIQTIQKG